MEQKSTEIPNTTSSQIWKSLKSWQGIGIKILKVLLLSLVSTEDTTKIWVYEIHE